MRFGSLGKKKEVTIHAPDDDENVPSAKPAEDNDEEADTSDPTTDKVMDTAIEVRGDTIISLKRTEANIRMTEESGGESMQTLKKNDEILKRCEAIAERMEVKTFQGEVASMGRKLSRDKCFLILTVLAVCAVIVTIVLPLAKPRLKDIDIFSTGDGSNATL